MRVHRPCGSAVEALASIGSGRALIAVALTTGLLLGAADGVANAQSNDHGAFGVLTTPFGATRAGNADGTIPEWTGGITRPPANYRPGQGYVDPFPADSPRFTIRAENMQAHAAGLSPGLKALLRAYPETFYMNVFTTRRSAAFRQTDYDATRGNLGRARLSVSNNGVHGAGAGVPFPLPRSGAEVVWNHLLRFRSEGFEFHTVTAVPSRTGSYVPIQILRRGYSLYGRPWMELRQLEKENVLVYYLEHVTGPARLAGRVFLGRIPLDFDRRARTIWTYSRGDRRVRKTSNLRTDIAYPHSDGLMVVDDFDMFSGTPGDFEWQLLGKREMYIPYNDYRMLAEDHSDLVQPFHLNPEFLRYELHRVWVVEGRLAKGKTHVYHRRVLYVDEDSWQIAISEAYSADGQLWRVGMLHPVNYYTWPIQWIGAEVHHDLDARKYVALYLRDRTLGAEGVRLDADLSLGDFTPSGIRRLYR